MAKGKKKIDHRKEIERLAKEAGLKVEVAPLTQGQPTKYKPEFCEMLILHMSQGLSFESFAADANVARATLYNWQDENPDFLDAHKTGEAKRMKFYESVGVSGMSGHLPGFSASTWIFSMKNVAKWTDRQDLTSGDKPLPEAPPQVIITLPSNGREAKK